MGDILRKLQMGGTGLLLLRQPEGFAGAGRDVVGAGELVRVFGDRPHHVDHIEDLEPALLRFLDGFLAGDHQHRHAAQKGIGRRGDEIGRAGPERGEAHARLAGMAAIGGGHEAGALFVAGQNQAYLGRSLQAVEKIEILLAGHAEHIFAALCLKALHQKIRGLGHRSHS